MLWAVSQTVIYFPCSLLEQGKAKFINTRMYMLFDAFTAFIHSSVTALSCSESEQFNNLFYLVEKNQLYLSEILMACTGGWD